MFNYLLKGVFAAMAVKLLDNYRHLSVRLLRIEAAKSYVLGVRAARNATARLLRMELLVGLICVGVALFHAGLFILLPWSLPARALLGMALGAVYTVAGGVALCSCMDERRWMESSGAKALLKDVIQNSAGSVLS
jgi:hypothetical protein